MNDTIVYANKFYCDYIKYDEIENIEILRHKYKGLYYNLTFNMNSIAVQEYGVKSYMFHEDLIYHNNKLDIVKEWLLTNKPEEIL